MRPVRGRCRPPGEQDDPRAQPEPHSHPVRRHRRRDSRHAGGPGADRRGPRVLAGHRRAARQRRGRAAQLADVLRQLQGPALQRPRPDRPAQRRGARDRVGLPAPGARPRRDDPAGGRRRHVHHRIAQHRHRRRRGHGPPLLALRARAAGRGDHLLRAQQPRRRRAGRPRPHEHPRRAPGGPRRSDRQRPLGYGGPQLVRRLQQDRGPARRRRQGLHRRRGRRVRHPRPGRRLRHRERRAGVALLHHAEPGPSRQPHLVGRFVAHRRRRDLDDRLLRPRAEPPLLGHRQSRTGLRRHRARGRQPLLRLRRGPRRRHGRAPLVLPVHAARHPRLGLDADPGAGRHGVRGRAAQAHALPEPQRVLLRARPRDRRVPARRALRAADLGGGPRRDRPSHPAPRQGADPRGDRRLPRHHRRLQLVVAHLQPPHRASST